MKYIFIVNPAAGKGKLYEGLTEKIENACKTKGVDYEVYLTRGVGDATAYVKEYAENHPSSEICFFACGGDGTLCEVANGIMAVPDRDRLCIGTLPSGTGNDFVRCFSSSENFLNVDAQLSGSPMYIDLIGCNDMYSVNMINIGFDCEVVCKKQELQQNKIFPSKLAYVVGLVITLIRKPGVKCRMALSGGEMTEKDLLLTTFGNGEYCGGGFHSNPESSVCNGKINVLTVNNISRMKFVSIVGQYKKGTHLCHTDILRSSLEDSVDMSFDGPTNISIDGEVVKVESLRLYVAKRALRFMVPYGSKCLKDELYSEEKIEATV